MVHESRLERFGLAPTWYMDHGWKDLAWPLHGTWTMAGNVWLGPYMDQGWKDLAWPLHGTRIKAGKIWLGPYMIHGPRVDTEQAAVLQEEVC